MHNEHEHEHNHEENHISCCCGHDHHHHEEEAEETSLKKIIIAGILFLAGLFLDHVDLKSLFPSVQALVIYQKQAMLAVSLVSYLLVGRDVVKQALLNLIHGNVFDEQFLMSVASLGAVCIGQIPEAVAIMLFYQIGEYFEDYAVDKSKDSINSLMKIRPNSATVLSDDAEKEVSPEEVEIGQIILVRPGERVPVDGIVIKGNSFIDNSALTGESVPVEVIEGSEIFSGAINKDSAIQIKTTKAAEDSAAERIIKMVENASEKKTKTERFITRFSRIYTPFVCAMALLVCLVPTAFIGFKTGVWQWKTWVFRSLMFLVVSCPCAIVISIPLTFFGGIGKASKKGILLKGSGNIEKLSRTKIAVFDKTGTLTKGVFNVTEICPASSDMTKEELLSLAACAESNSNHPVAKSICRSCQSNSKNNLKPSETTELAGQGIKALINGKTVLAGNSRLMESEKVSGFKDIPEKTGTIIHLSEDGKYLGHIVISDEEKSDSKKAVRKLLKTGVSKIVMLTGDNLKVAEKIAKELGINDVYAELLPADKVEKVEELISQLSNKESLCFAGDGINDAPVLARADVGIAMGALGSDAAIESADVVIMTDEPSKIPEAISISRKTISIVYQNIVLSLGIKAAIMILSALGISNMWVAVFGDVGVTFLAILNSMRALGFSHLKKL